LIDLLPENSGKAIDSISVDVASVPSPREAQTFGDWMNSLIPINLFAALSEGHLLPIMLFTVAFALALNRLESPGKQIVHQFFEAVFEAMMTLVGFIMKAARSQFSCWRFRSPRIWEQSPPV
jgi:Na+/H+-dicarboxylate symporter